MGFGNFRKLFIDCHQIERVDGEGAGEGAVVAVRISQRAVVQQEAAECWIDFVGPVCDGERSRDVVEDVLYVDLLLVLHAEEAAHIEQILEGAVLLDLVSHQPVGGCGQLDDDSQLGVVVDFNLRSRVLHQPCTVEATEEGVELRENFHDFAPCEIARSVVAA